MRSTALCMLLVFGHVVAPSGFLSGCSSGLRFNPFGTPTRNDSSANEATASAAAAAATATAFALISSRSTKGREGQQPAAPRRPPASRCTGTSSHRAAQTPRCRGITSARPCPAKPPPCTATHCEPTTLTSLHRTVLAGHGTAAYRYY